MGLSTCLKLYVIESASQDPISFWTTSVSAEVSFDSS